MEEIVRAFNHIIDQGKVFYWGTSMWNADEIAQAWRYSDKLGLIGPIIEKPAYNMLDRVKVEQEYAHLCREVGLGLTVFSPMRQGILPGKYSDGIPGDSRFANEEIKWVNGFWKQAEKDTWTAIIEQVNQLKPIADRLGLKQSQLALACVLSNKNVSSAITGASSPEQMYENARAVAAVRKLTPEILEEIDVILNNKPPEVIERF